MLLLVGSTALADISFCAAVQKAILDSESGLPTSAAIVDVTDHAAWA
ncbi:hypothetical protein [Bradyrhizobium sp. CCBAU 53415]|nr:hypothetical protein [Bradyrhizobium sp. CCBAU 53415]